MTPTGNGPDGGAYRAHYNGFFPGSEFSEQFARPSPLAPVEAMASFNDPGVGHRPSVRLSRHGTCDVHALAFDLASGDELRVVPEPTTALLLLPLAFALRRR